LIAGLIRQMRGTMDMNRLGGLYGNYPKLSLVIALVLFSLAGIPPLSGFWPKIYLIEASFLVNNGWMIAGIIIGSFITLYVLAKLWASIFWKEASTDAIIQDSFAEMDASRKIFFVLPILLLAAVTLYLGFNAEMIINISDKIATEMLDTTPYEKAVLGE